MAVTYAVALGLRVIGIDGGADKEKARLSMPRELFLTKSRCAWRWSVKSGSSERAHVQQGCEHFLDFTKTKDLVGEVSKLTNGGARKPGFSLRLQLTTLRRRLGCWRLRFCLQRSHRLPSQAW
jgi:hypothetical protein